MKKYYLLALTFLLMVGFSACSITMNMTTNKRPEYDQSLFKVFIVGNSTSDFEKDINFLTAVTKVLSDSLRAADVDNEFKIKSPLSLNSDEEIENEISNYIPTQIMQINIKMRNPDSSEVYSLELSIIDQLTKKIVWKGVINGIPDYLAYGNMKSAVNMIMKNLRHDGML